MWGLELTHASERAPDRNFRHSTRSVIETYTKRYLPFVTTWSERMSPPQLCINHQSTPHIEPLTSNQFRFPTEMFLVRRTFLPYFWYPLNIENAIRILAFRGIWKQDFLTISLRNGCTLLCYNFNSFKNLIPGTMNPCNGCRTRSIGLLAHSN